MKTITKAEYEALPEASRRYWKEYSYLSDRWIPITCYTPVTIYLEDAVGVIDDLKIDIGATLAIADQVIQNSPGYQSGSYLAVANVLKPLYKKLTEALKQLKSLKP